MPAKQAEERVGLQVPLTGLPREGSGLAMEAIGCYSCNPIWPGQILELAVEQGVTT